VCTLTLAWQVFDDAPVAVAANRDEALEREALPPAVYSEEPLIVAPSDAEAGGTWIGYNEYGVFVGITNKWTDADLAGERSRGLLVADVLEARSAADAKSIVEAATDADEYDGFYLIVADAADAFCYEWDGALPDRVRAGGSRRRQRRRRRRGRRPVGPDRCGSRASGEREISARGARARVRESAAAWLERAGDVLGDHEFGVCIHRNGYGTRSSSLIALGPETARYAFAPGPPCRTSYDDVSVRTGDGATDPEHGATRPTRTLHSKGKGTFKRLAPSRMDMDALLPVATHTARWSP